jgi:hypothetical protein
VEIALYNMYSILSEMELGSVYRMSKANDVYSGLGQQDKLLEVKSADAAGSGEEAVAAEEKGEKKDLVSALAEECEEAEREQQEEVERAAAAAEGAAEIEKESALTPPPPPTAAEEAAAVVAASTAAAKPAAVAEPASGVAQQLAALEKRKKREAALVRAIQRAETIVESYEGIKVRLLACRYRILPRTGAAEHSLSSRCLCDITICPIFTYFYAFPLSIRSTR